MQKYIQPYASRPASAGNVQILRPGLKLLKKLHPGVNNCRI